MLGRNSHAYAHHSSELSYNHHRNAHPAQLISSVLSLPMFKYVCSPLHAK